MKSPLRQRPNSSDNWGLRGAMTYFPDMSPCSYFGPQCARRLTAVGWLSHEHSYTTGDVSQAFIDKLLSLLIDPWQPYTLMGFHECEFCRISRGPRDIRWKGQTVPMGFNNLFVPGKDNAFVAPSLIAHYIDCHNYAPPTDFCAAVLACPQMRSMDYLRNIARLGLTALRLK